MLPNDPRERVSFGMLRFYSMKGPRQFNRRVKGNMVRLQEDHGNMKQEIGRASCRDRVYVLV